LSTAGLAPHTTIFCRICCRSPRTNKLIFIDERGSGRSQKLEDASKYTVENMVEDVEDVRQALGLGKISLMGHSYGGVLAQAYALKYQKNLTHLILGSTFLQHVGNQRDSRPHEAEHARG